LGMVLLWLLPEGLPTATTMFPIRFGSKWR